MDFDALWNKYHALWEREVGERDEPTYQAIVEAIERDTPLDDLKAWAASQHLRTDKDTWKIFRVFLDDLYEVEQTETARERDELSSEAEWSYLEGTDAAWHVSWEKRR